MCGSARLLLLCSILLLVNVKHTSPNRHFEYLLKLAQSVPPMKKFLSSLEENGTLRDTLETLPFAESLVRGALPLFVSKLTF